MKHLRRTAALLLALLLILSALPIAGMAEPVSKVLNLKTENWYTATKYASKLPAYKVVLEEDAVLKVSWKGAANTSLYVKLFTNKACTKEPIFLNDSSAASGSKEYAMGAGTYYLQMYDFKDKSKVQYKVTPVSKLNVANYCATKAVSLAANKSVKIAQSPHNSYARWYKIKLTKKQKIYVSAPNSAYFVTLFDSKMNQISRATAVNGNSVTSSEAQPKGTYYIRVSSSDFFYGNHGEVVNFKWK